MVTSTKAYCPPFKLQTKLNFLGIDCIVTDLSHTISKEDPTFIGHQRTLIWEHLSHDETQKMGLTKPPYSYKVVGFTMCDHSGTHVDAINHIVNDPDARAINELPMEWFIAPAVWFDFSHKAPNSYITKSDIEEAIALTGVTIKPQSVVLYYTGWYKKWDKPFDYIRDYPGVDRSAIEYLNDLGAISIGADAPSIDSYHEVAVVKEQPAHIVCREREILNMENLAQVDMIPGHEFWFLGLPLKIKGGSGSPFRCVAIIPENKQQ
ncbi:Kynurenine formamidase [Chitinophaga sp. MM2321]